MKLSDLGNLVKQKYQQYVDIPADKLGKLVVSKYPVYRQKVDDYSEQVAMGAKGLMDDTSDVLNTYQSNLPGVMGQGANLLTRFAGAQTESYGLTAENLGTDRGRAELRVGISDFPQQSFGEKLENPATRVALDSLDVVPGLGLAAGTAIDTTRAGKRSVSSLINGVGNFISKNPKLMQMVDETVDIAKQQQPGFSQMLSDLAGKVGRNFGVGPVKDRERAFVKLVNEEKEIIENVRDWNRGVILVDNFHTDLDSVLEQTKGYFGDLINQGRIKDSRADEMFKKIIVNVPGDRGVMTEVQLTTPAMWKAKMDLGGDALYHKYRLIPKDTKDHKLIAEQDKLWNQMKELYDRAFAETDSKIVTDPEFVGQGLREFTSDLNMKTIGKRSITMPEYRDYDTNLKAGRQIVEPITVFAKDPFNQDSPIQIIDGWHRWRQAVANGDKTIPVRFIYRPS